MTKIKSIFLICLSVILFGCNNSNSSSGSSQGPVEQPEYTTLFNVSSYDLTVGDNIQLDYNTTAGAAVSFVSNDTTVVSVTDTGVVSALKQGSAVIEMTLTINGKTQKDKCTINVTDKDITFIGYQNESITLEVNEKITPALTILPSDLINNGIEYKIVNTDIADVDAHGAVTGKKAGETILEASYKNLKTSINVIVQAEETIKVESITLNCTDIISLYQGETHQLVYEIKPEDAENKNVIFTSDNKDVATVYPNGLITAQNAGNATITAETEDGKKQASCSVTVNAASVPLESISIDDVILENGTSKFIQAKITPENAKFSNLKVQQPNDSVTITNADRTLLLVTAKKQGYFSRINIEAENCEPAENTSCSKTFDIYTYDNNTASLPEYLELAEPYNMVMPDGENFKIYMNFEKGDKFNPLSAVNYIPFNSVIDKELIAVNTPEVAGNGQVIYYSKEDGLIHAQGTGEAMVEIEVLRNTDDEYYIAPVKIPVIVASDESQIPYYYKICPAKSIVIDNKQDLKNNLILGSKPVFVYATVTHQADCSFGKVDAYKIETSDKNIVDIIDGYAYAKKAGKAVITVTSNSIYTIDNKPVKASVEIEVK